MKLSALQRRAHRRARKDAGMDMNLVALIDVFTILLFFLLSSAGSDEALSTPDHMQLPMAHAEKAPQPSLVLAIDATDITVDGRRVAGVAEVLASPDALIAPLQAALAQIAAATPLSPDAERATGAPAAQTRAVTIMGDQDIPYALLRKVMATCAQAQFGDVSFAVRRKSMS